MRIKKISQPLEVESNVIDSLESNSTKNAPSIHAVNEGLKNVYSTEEKRIGTWIDGKPLYRRVLIGTTPLTEGTWGTIDDISNILEITRITGVLGGYLPVPNFIDSSYYVGLQQYGGNEIQAYVKGFINSPIKVIVEYTKTTD